MMATVGVGGALGLTALTPFVSSLMPSERAKAAGAPVEVDIGKLAPGDMMIVEWRGKPVWILNRTPEMLAALKKAEPMLADPASEKQQQPAYATNETRSRRPEMLVAVGCTHLGCSPSTAFTPGDAALGADWPGGFSAPATARPSTSPAASSRTSRHRPTWKCPHQYLSESRLVIGSDEQDKA
jgi:ubiquinol-cytochrome c reductase iron-sulfur subunit